MRVQIVSISRGREYWYDKKSAIGLIFEVRERNNRGEYLILDTPKNREVYSAVTGYSEYFNGFWIDEEDCIIFDGKNKSFSHLLEENY